MNRRTRISIVMLSALAAYVVSYVILSLCGAYEFGQSGKMRYSFGLSVSDIEQWQPRFVRCRIFQQVDGTRTLQANPLGYVFAPAILLDQKLFHRTKWIFDESKSYQACSRQGRDSVPVSNRKPSSRPT